MTAGGAPGGLWAATVEASSFLLLRIMMTMARPIKPRAAGWTKLDWERVGQNLARKLTNATNDTTHDSTDGG